MNGERVGIISKKIKRRAQGDYGFCATTCLAAISEVLCTSSAPAPQPAPAAARLRWQHQSQGQQQPSATKEPTESEMTLKNPKEKKGHEKIFTGVGGLGGGSYLLVFCLGI